MYVFKHEVCEINEQGFFFQYDQNVISETDDSQCRSFFRHFRQRVWPSRS